MPMVQSPEYGREHNCEFLNFFEIYRTAPVHFTKGGSFTKNLPLITTAESADLKHKTDFSFQYNTPVNTWLKPKVGNHSILL